MKDEDIRRTVLEVVKEICLPDLPSGTPRITLKMLVSFDEMRRNRSFHLALRRIVGMMNLIA